MVRIDLAGGLKPGGCQTTPPLFGGQTMKTLKTLLVASFLAMGATSLVAAPALAGDKKAEMKCDAKGKACKKGADCKAENCKKEGGESK